MDMDSSVQARRHQHGSLPSFQGPTRAQTDGWQAIQQKGSHTLIHAPTGSGKTLAAFLWSLDRLLHAPVPERAERCRVLYISPLKALAYDVDRNLRAPLRGIRHADRPSWNSTNYPKSPPLCEPATRQLMFAGACSAPHRTFSSPRLSRYFCC